MAVIKVVKKESEIDGKPITWNVLSIVGYLAGDYQTLEVKLDRTQAMLAGMLLESEETPGSTEARSANKDEKAEFNKGITVK